MITIKTEKEIDDIREGGKILANVLQEVAKLVKPGATTGELELLACELILKSGGKPSFKGYRTSKKEKAFPTALCVSINNEVVHVPALPARMIKEGDIVSIDIGMEYLKLFTDMAITVPCGVISDQAKKLLAATKKSLELAIKKIKPGLSLYELGKTVEDYIDEQGFSVVRQLVGHGVGHHVHEDPQIPNYAVESNKNICLKEGMVIAVEPMVNVGRWQITADKSGWIIKTEDGSLSAHFEHTIAVTKNGYKVMTEL
ncbi:MAG: type I methionyl aminopeptidase [bacterium]